MNANELDEWLNYMGGHIAECGARWMREGSGYRRFESRGNKYSMHGAGSILILPNTVIMARGGIILHGVSKHCQYCMRTVVRMMEEDGLTASKAQP